MFRLVILLILAVVLITPVSAEQLVWDENNILVVVSEIDFDPYERVIEEHMVKRVKYPERLLPRYCPLDVKDVLGKLPTEPIKRGEIISLQRLVDKDEYREDLIRLVPPGQFYTTLPFVIPNEYGGLKMKREIVDIVAVFKEGEEKVVRVAAQNARLAYVGDVQEKFRPCFVIIRSREEANSIGHLRTMPEISWHLLFKVHTNTDKAEQTVLKQQDF